MTADLQATLDAGPAGEFFQRVMAQGDAAPAQFANADTVITRAIESGDPSLAEWAGHMQAALNSSAEAEAIERTMARDAAADPIGLGRIGDFIEKFTNALKEALSDGKFDMSDFQLLFNALSGADPNMERLTAHRQAAAEAMRNGDSALEGARLNGTDVAATLGTDNAKGIVDGAREAIDRIAPSPQGPGQ